MSHLIARKVMDSKTVRGARRSVLLCLAYYADDEGECWPSQKRLAADTMLTHRGVRKIMDALIAGGEIEVIEQGHGRGNSTRYRLAKYAEKGEQKGNNGSPIPEKEKGNAEAGKGERRDTKGEPESTKGEPSVPPKIKEDQIEDQKNPNDTQWWPENLRVPEFQRKWKEFEEYSREKGNPIPPSARRAQLGALGKYPLMDAIAFINRAIVGNWRGLNIDSPLQPNQQRGNGKPTVPHNQKSKWGI